MKGEFTTFLSSPSCEMTALTYVVVIIQRLSYVCNRSTPCYDDAHADHVYQTKRKKLSQNKIHREWASAALSLSTTKFFLFFIHSRNYARLYCVSTRKIFGPSWVTVHESQKLMHSVNYSILVLIVLTME